MRRARSTARWIASLLTLLVLAAPARAADAADPLGSSRWRDMRELFFANARIEFDARVAVSAPRFAEDSLAVPIAVDASGLRDVDEVLVFADFNPIVKVLSFQPRRAKPYLAFRMKLQQSSPVRAAARTRDGVWHLGGTWVEAAGGGCTAPSLGRAGPDWASTLNRVSGRVWPAEGGASRVRLRVMHPMDTGLAPGIPAFFLEQIELRDARDGLLISIAPQEPVAENPVFTLDVVPALQAGEAVFASGVDNNGNRFRAGVRP